MAIDSDSLIRLGKQEMPSLSSKEAERLTLSARVNAFLAGGGVIKQVETGASAIHYPVKQSRKSTINFLKRRDFNRSKKPLTPRP